MDIHLHLGMPKTGSSAIQQSLHAAKESLLARGYRVPQTGLHCGAHHGLEKELRRGGPGQLWEVALSEAKPGESLVISAEGLWFVEPEAIERLAQRFEQHRVKAYLYLRRPDDFLASLYRQRIKGSGRFETVRQFLDHRDSDVDYPRIVGQWSSHFEIRCRAYELVRSNIVHDFSEALGLDDGVLMDSEQAINATPNDGALRVMWCWNRMVPKRLAAGGRWCIEVCAECFRWLGKLDDSLLREKGRRALDRWTADDLERVGIPIEALRVWRQGTLDSN